MIDMLRGQPPPCGVETNAHIRHSISNVTSFITVSVLSFYPILVWALYDEEPGTDVLSLAVHTQSSRTRRGSYMRQLLIGYLRETRASLRQFCLNVNTLINETLTARF